MRTALPPFLPWKVSLLSDCNRKVLVILYCFINLATSAPFVITSYEPGISLAEKGSNKTLSCEVTVDEEYDMELVSVQYRYYATPKVTKSIEYNAEISTDTVNNTITAKLDIGSVETQHYGIYECYARSLPADLYIDPDDYFYETARNTTLNITIQSPGNYM